MARGRIGPTRIATGRRTPDVPCNMPSVPLATKRAYALSLSETSSCASKVARMSATCCEAFVVPLVASEPPAWFMRFQAHRLRSAFELVATRRHDDLGQPT